ncbi:chitinase N-terminal domain-containing protein [Shewanella sp.]|uniref:fibronectin type III domain-containing protein n=1 Tax=Shewanella sp. TaxID=50422 RepID=UPI003F3E932D
MKTTTTTIAMFIGMLFSQPTLANNNEQAFFIDTYQAHHELMSKRLQALRADATAGKDVIIQNGQRYMDVNGSRYRLNNDNYILFDMPKPNFLDETKLRNIFDFFNEDWELTWYDGGMVAVNTLFGNYDYGNGCLMEYSPGNSALESVSRISSETSSCGWVAPPQASPANLTLVNVSDNHVELSWQQAEGATDYRIYRDGIAVANGAAIKDLHFSDLGLNPQTHYRYQVEACNQHGCAADKSSELNVETLQAPEVLPAPPLRPTVINSGSRTNVINWQPVPGATFYQLTRNGELIADKLTTFSFTNSRLEINSQYEYTVLACNEHGCSEPSQSVIISTTERDKLDIRVQHKDPTTPSIGINVHTENGPSVMYSANVSYSADNVYRYNREIYSAAHVDGGRYRVTIYGQPTNGQLCSTNAPSYKRTGGKNAEAIIDCLTKASLVSNLKEELNFTLADNFEYYLPKPSLYRAADNQRIESSAFEFVSLDENVLTIDEMGKITLLSPGKAIIQVRANPDYYDVDDILEYQVNVAGDEQPIVLQRLEIGQATLLSPGAPHQVLSPKGTTMVRAYAYARQAGDTQMPVLTLSIDANGQQLRKSMTCPHNAKVGSFTSPSYELNEVCYAIIEGDEAAEFITPGMLLTVSSNHGLTLTSEPKVNRHGTFNLKLIPGLDSNGVAKNPNISEFSATLRQTYPLTKTNISVREAVDLGSELTPALGRVDQLRKLETDGLTYFYGLVPGVCYGTVGLAYQPGAAGVGRDAGCSWYLRSTFIHEMGHNFGLPHAPGCGPTSSDPFWASNAWEGVSRAALSPAPLFEQSNRSVISPKDKLIHADSDAMNYCLGDRFSEYNYQRLANYVNSKSWFSDQPMRSKMIQQREPMLLISGEIIDNKVLMEPIIASNNPLGSQDPLENDPSNPQHYTMLVNANDGIIMHDLPLIKLDHGDNQRFSIEIPASAHINAIKFFDGEQELSLEINGLKTQQQLNTHSRFTAQTIDFQGDYVHWNNQQYPWLTLVYTKTDGSRQTLALNVTGGELAIDQAKLDGGSLHFSLSDGINSVIHTEVLPQTQPQTGVADSTVPSYQAGTAYQAGDRVSHGGDSYECKPFPYSGWCGGSSSHYAPGTGSHWTDAWFKL